MIPLSGALFGYGPWIRSAIVYAEPEALAAVRDASEWGSIERIEFALGSARMISPRMANVRAIGPLTLDQLAPLRIGSWKIRELDVEIDREPSDLVTHALPLTTLRLRPDRALAASWITRLDELARSPTLERIEIWLTGGVTTEADAARMFREAVGRVGDKTLVVGVLDTGQPTGWTLVSHAGVHTVELAKPDLRFGSGSALAAEVEVTPPLVDLDQDWLTFALGVPSIQPL